MTGRAGPVAEELTTRPGEPSCEDVDDRCPACGRGERESDCVNSNPPTCLAWSCSRGEPPCGGGSETACNCTPIDDEEDCYVTTAANEKVGARGASLATTVMAWGVVLAALGVPALRTSVALPTACQGRVGG